MMTMLEIRYARKEDGAAIKALDQLSPKHSLLGWQHFRTLLAIEPATGVVIGILFWDSYQQTLHAEVLFVHPDYRRRGIATRLLACFEAVAQNYGLRRVDLYADAPKLVEFYQKRGYRIAPEKSNAVRMVKPVSPEHYTFCTRRKTT